MYVTQHTITYCMQVCKLLVCFDGICRCICLSDLMPSAHTAMSRCGSKDESDSIVQATLSLIALVEKLLKLVETMNKDNL